MLGMDGTLDAGNGRDADKDHRVAFDIQDRGIQELRFISAEADRLQAQLTQHLAPLPTGRASSSFEYRVSSSSTDLSGRLRSSASAHLQKQNQDSELMAQVKMGLELKAENSHLSAKRYLLDAWKTARSSNEITDACMYQVAKAIMESGYLDDNPTELSRVIEIAVSFSRFERDERSRERSPAFLDRRNSGSRTPDSLNRSSILNSSGDNVIFSDAGSVSAFAEGGDMSWEQRGKQLEALVSMGIRLSKLLQSPVQVTQGRRSMET